MSSGERQCVTRYQGLGRKEENRLVFMSCNPLNFGQQLHVWAHKADET